MNKDFVTFEQSVKLASLAGFEVPALVNFYPNPTYSQAFRWFREKHNIYCIILASYADSKVIKDRFFYEVAIGGKIKQELEYHATYEEAESACLDKLIEMVRANG